METARNSRGPEPAMKLFAGNSLKCKQCCKTCLTSEKERDNAWLRELIGRLSMARGVICITPGFPAQGGETLPADPAKGPGTGKCRGRLSLRGFGGAITSGG